MDAQTCTGRMGACSQIELESGILLSGAQGLGKVGPTLRSSGCLRRVVSAPHPREPLQESERHDGTNDLGRFIYLTATSIRDCDLI